LLLTLSETSLHVNPRVARSSSGMCVDYGEHGKTGVSDRTRGTHGGGVLEWGLATCLVQRAKGSKFENRSNLEPVARWTIYSCSSWETDGGGKKWGLGGSKKEGRATRAPPDRLYRRPNPCNIPRIRMSHGWNLVMACVGVGPSNDSDSPSHIPAPGGACFRGKQDLTPDL
jgi:hypothetical protein